MVALGLLAAACTSDRDSGPSTVTPTAPTSPTDPATPPTTPRTTTPAPTAPSTTPAVPRPSTTTEPGAAAGPGENFVVAVRSEGIGDVAVRVSLPDRARFDDGAGVVVEVATFFTPTRGFYSSSDATDVGLIYITYLWPGTSDPEGYASDGEFDYGGDQSIRALRDVIRFAAGNLPDSEGRFLDEMVAVTPLEVGLYAFSHPGLAAINVLALYGDELDVSWLVGRENPTEDVTSAVEIGHWGDDGRPVPNPRYRYPDSYSPTSFDVDFGGARWDPDYTDPDSRFVGRAYLDLDGDGALSGADFLFGSRIPTMFDKRFHSVALTRALAAGGSLTADTWPEDLATVAEAEAIWPFQRSTRRYPTLGDTAPDLMVMLVFADRPHVQPALDRPSVHQAYDGLRNTAGLWVRLNPDRSYVEALAPDLGAVAPDNPANREPPDWLDSRAWAYRDVAGANTLVPLAAVAEMADRAHLGVSDANLDVPLVEFGP